MRMSWRPALFPWDRYSFGRACSADYCKNDPELCLPLLVMCGVRKVLEDDMDLAMMNLTRMFITPEDYVPPLPPEVLQDHEEMELLLEAYLQVGRRMGQEAT